VAHVDLWNIGRAGGDPTSHIWSLSSAKLPTAFKEPVATWPEFERRVKSWLEADSRRRVLLLLDEADAFIKADARSEANEEFREFRRLQGLMDDTGHRFKFVLAGLQNVTRLVQSDNSPLQQNASDAQRIGPLLGRDRIYAEQLITKPMAAMGFVFEHREDVWSILSHTNYYPVLAQLFCASLLDDIAREAAQSRQITWKISSEQVRRTLDNPRLAAAIKEKFEYTIKELDPRYELLTYVIAEKSLRDQTEGQIAQGTTAEEIRTSAVRYWPKAFDRLNQVAAIENLLDEMVGLGVLRETVPNQKWTLRSASILHLLGKQDRISALLDEFAGREVREEFEPRMVRRLMRQSRRTKEIENEQPSPLTTGQEFDLLNEDTSIRVVFGSNLSDIGIVSQVLESVPFAPSGRKPSVKLCFPRTLQDAMMVIRGVKARDGERPVRIIDMQSGWNRDWVIELQTMKQVRDRSVRVVFVGGPQQALNWVADNHFAKAIGGVKVVPLQPWTSPAINHMLEREGVTVAIRPQFYELLGDSARLLRKSMQEARPSELSTGSRALRPR
jgi:hypothetical protein